MPHFSTFRRICQTALAVCAIAAAPVKAAQLGWSLDPANHTLSDGTTPLPNGAVFQIGVFEGDFTPTLANQSQWLANWRAADFSPYLADLQSVSGDYNVEVNNAPFTVGKQMYVWGVFQKPDGSSEQWLGAGPDWLVPDGTQVIVFPYYIYISDATTVLLGTVDSGTGAIKMTAMSAAFGIPRIYGRSWLDHYYFQVQLDDPNIGGWNADPDGDGFSNALEYQMGTDPNVASSHGGVSFVPQGAGFVLSFPSWAYATSVPRVEQSQTLTPPWTVVSGGPTFSPATGRWSITLPKTAAKNFFRVATGPAAPFP